VKEGQRQPDDLERRVRRLVKSAGRSPGAVAAELRALGPDAIAPLCRLVGRETRQSRILDILARFCFLIVLAGYLRQLHTGFRDPTDILMIPTGLFAVSGPLFLKRWFRTRDGATAVLSAIDDVRAVGPLLDAKAARFDLDASIAVRETLASLLVRLRATDAALLEPRHIAALGADLVRYSHWRWTSGGDVAYVGAILKALEQVGDETCVPDVETLIRTTRSPRLRGDAEACLPFLQERAKIGKQTLLRPAAQPEQASDSLLRAASSGQRPLPEQLLRASGSEAES
jgi:hypothetical protein